MIRFVVGPDLRVAPDLAEKLPGRGFWVSASRAALEKAIKKNLFNGAYQAARKAGGAAVAVPEGMIDLVERGLAKRLIEAIAICRKAGLAVAGAEKARAAAPNAAVLVQASDGAEDGKRKLRRLAPQAPEIDCLDRVELGLAFGRASVIHAVLTPGGATDRAVRESLRLKGVRTPTPAK